MGQSWLWVVHAWGQGCMVVHRIGPELVLRVGLIVDGDRFGWAWYQGWLCMGSGLGCGGRAGCTWGQGQYVRPWKHAWTLEPFIF